MDKGAILAEVRSVVNDLFRGLTLPRNPQLWQSLPTEKQEQFQSSPEFVEIEKELAALRGRRDADPSSRRRCSRELYAKRRELTHKEVRKWQKAQSHQPSGKDSSSPCYRRSIFNRVRFMMPERNRLASSLFKPDTLRSTTSLSALRGMVTLCEKEAEVEFRPGLEPEKYWRHVYSCYKRSHDDFVELCFLCSKWIFGETQWSNHCQTHLNCPETLPVQCDPLVYGGALVTAGYCVFCMADPSLPSEKRLHQYLERGPWKDHV
ncbi:hypothetical protein B0T26DRAFT_849947, partial [Lasiosphaeria miniovina]